MERARHKGHQPAPDLANFRNLFKERNLRRQVNWLQKSTAPSLTARANQPRRPEVCLPFPQGTGRVTERLLRIQSRQALGQLCPAPARVYPDEAQ